MMIPANTLTATQTHHISCRPFNRQIMHAHTLSATKNYYCTNCDW